MSKLLAGYAEVNTTPPLGIPMRGYFIPRYASGVITELQASALVLELAAKKIAIVAVD
ncbi:MAG: hypothetical protein IJB48_00545 [Clostridia bacterium]|nr:hypothetical protein [Clostridia bacterium]